MKLIRIARDEIVNLDAIAYARYDDGAQPGTADKLTILYQFGEPREFRDDAAKSLWDALQSHCQPKAYA
jgi:hypothetical protein